MVGPERAGRGSAEVFGVPVGMRKPVTDAGAAFVTGKIFCIINILFERGNINGKMY